MTSVYYVDFNYWVHKPPVHSLMRVITGMISLPEITVLSLQETPRRISSDWGTYHGTDLDH